MVERISVHQSHSEVRLLSLEQLLNLIYINTKICPNKTTPIKDKRLSRKFAFKDKIENSISFCFGLKLTDKLGSDVQMSENCAVA